MLCSGPLGTFSATLVRHQLVGAVFQLLQVLIQAVCEQDLS